MSNTPERAARLKEGRTWTISLCLDNVVRVRESTFKLTGFAETTAYPVGAEREFPDAASAFAALTAEVQR
jgi:hypothetical protein